MYTYVIYIYILYGVPYIYIYISINIVLYSSFNIHLCQFIGVAPKILKCLGSQDFDRFPRSFSGA